MRVVFLNPSLSSGLSGARSLRGVIAELGDRGHDADVLEPARLRAAADLTVELGDADLVVVHDSNPSALVERVGDHHRDYGGYRLLFHTTDPAVPTDDAGIDSIDLSGYDGILAGSEASHHGYLEAGWQGRTWAWREAADTRIFHPLPATEPEADLVSFASWANAEQSTMLRDLLLRPARQLRACGARSTVRLRRAWRGSASGSPGFTTAPRSPTRRSRSSSPGTG